MRSEIILAGAIVAVAVIGVRYMDVRDAAIDHARNDDKTLSGPTPIAAVATPAYSAASGWGSEVRIAASRDNQFYVEADVNRRAAHFLVDTGASYVAMRDTDARNAGIYTSWADYTYPVRTANGETKAAFVTLEEMEIGDIRVKNVKAFILPDEQLSVNLLGMSFLSRIESVEARSGELLLRG
jgi:aspartyl protease family protein